MLSFGAFRLGVHREVTARKEIWNNALRDQMQTQPGIKGDFSMDLS
jgi:hypothetical protein